MVQYDKSIVDKNDLIFKYNLSYVEDFILEFEEKIYKYMNNLN